MAAMRPLVAFALCISTFCAASQIQRAEQRIYDLEAIPTQQAVRLISFGHPTTAANLYWLKAVQYIGEPKAAERGWQHLLPALDLVTAMDPGHGYAYQVGGIILGSVGRISESNAILEKGIAAVPSRYILAYLRAFNSFYYENDFAQAGHFVEIAARAPGAPAHLRQAALAFYVKGNEADAAIVFLERLRSEAQDPETAKALNNELNQALLEKYAQALDTAVAQFRATYGVYPAVLELLQATGFAREIPRDPFGGRLVLGEDGRVHSSVNPFRFKRPEEIERQVEPGVRPAADYPGVQLR